jgi:hypothetical protein
MKLTTDESVIVAKLKSQGCEVDPERSTDLSLAIRYQKIVLYIPRDEGDGYHPAHYARISDEVERFGLELLPLDYYAA